MKKAILSFSVISLLASPALAMPLMPMAPVARPVTITPVMSLIVPNLKATYQSIRTAWINKGIVR